MVRVLKWIGATLLAVVVLALGAYGISRAMGPTRAERAALEALTPGKPPAGRNGFAQLWLLPYAVPADEQAAVLKADLAAYAKSPEGFVTTAEKQWPHEQVNGVPGLRACGWTDQDCLARVRGNQAAYAALVARNAGLSARVEALGEADYVHNPFPLGLTMPTPTYQALGAPQTGHALAFVRGHRTEALAGICRDARTARMLWKRPDTLADGMISLAMLRGSANLFAEMLAQMPADAALPKDCQDAFAPFAQGGICAAMQGEFSYISANVQAGGWRLVEGAGAAEGRWLFDPGKTLARMAVRPAWTCQAPGQAQVKADKPVTVPADLGTGWNARCIANAAGCVLSNMETADFAPHLRRLQDGVAQARLVSVALWLRANPGKTLDDLPETLRQGRALQLDAEHKTLSMPLFAPQDGQARWSIPLPASRAD